MPKLTVAAVAKYAPQPQRREIRDSQAPGLYLVIQPVPSGCKSWVLRFRRHGKSAKLTLGRVDLSDTETTDEPTLGGALTLRQARQLANQIDRERARGVDVVAQRRAQKQAQRTAAAARAARSFGAAARDFFADHKTKWQSRPRRWRGDARVLGLRYPRDCDPARAEPEIIAGGLVSRWGDKASAEVDGHDIHAVVEEARKFGIPGLARHNRDTSEARGRKMHAALSCLFRWLLHQRRVAVNPCLGVWHPGPPPPRERILSDIEIVAFWQASTAMGAPYGGLFKILLLTGCRLNECAGMRHSEMENGVWTIPGTRTKNHRRHQLVLPPLAVEIIAAAPRVAGGDLVFSSTGARQLTGFSRAKAKLVAEMDGSEPWVLHDLRRTCASGMQKLGVRVEVIERALNHLSGSFKGVVGVYQTDPLTDDVRQALERWSRHVAGLVSGQPANVVPMRERVLS